tara:strand:- start:1300 stop:2133 length:834 start_codon:yes stop_codon:yes gene_type:complete
MPKSGHINDFHDYVSDLKKNEATFKVEFSGNSRIVHLLDAYGATIRKRLFFGYENDERMKGLEFIPMVRREIRKQLKEGLSVPEYVEGVRVVKFNSNNLKKAAESGKTLHEVDLNACYWVTAHKLGFISKELFQKGWKKRRECKLGLVASIGSLNKQTYIEHYEYGKSHGMKKDDKDHDLQPFYWAVINEVSRIMESTIEKLPKHHFMMWLTDCVYIQKESLELVESHFSELGFEHKKNTCHISNIQPNRVFWVNHKTGEEKYIFYSKQMDVAYVEK